MDGVDLCRRCRHEFWLHDKSQHRCPPPSEWRDWRETVAWYNERKGEQKQEEKGND